MKRTSRIVVRGQSAKDMINEINDPKISKEHLELFRKALEVNRKIKKNEK
ncbi:hypothetical protein ABE504_29585 [Paenibacillus oryzisoli]